MQVHLAILPLLAIHAKHSLHTLRFNLSLNRQGRGSSSCSPASYATSITQACPLRAAGPTRTSNKLGKIWLSMIWEVHQNGPKPGAKASNAEDEEDEDIVIESQQLAPNVNCPLTLTAVSSLIWCLSVHRLSLSGCARLPEESTAAQ